MHVISTQKQGYFTETGNMIEQLWNNSPNDLLEEGPILIINDDETVITQLNAEGRANLEIV